MLRPGGGLGLVWNDDDLVDAPAWVQLTDERKDRAGSGAVRRGVESSVAAAIAAGRFGPVERAEFRWTLSTTPAATMASIASRSYVISLPDEDRRALLAELSTALDAAVVATGSPELGHPQLTSAFWCRLR